MRNYFSIYRKREPNLACYWWRFVLGWGCLIDGLTLILSAGFINSTFGVEAAGRLVRARHFTNRGPKVGNRP